MFCLLQSFLFYFFFLSVTKIEIYFFTLAPPERENFFYNCVVHSFERHGFSIIILLKFELNFTTKSINKYLLKFRISEYFYHIVPVQKVILIQMEVLKINLRIILLLLFYNYIFELKFRQFNCHHQDTVNILIIIKINV